jgi:hypothetical protein
MIKKRYLLTGIVEMGDYIRLILYPDEPVKKKPYIDMMALAMSGDPSEMQRESIIQGMLSNNPPLIYITVKEFEESKLQLHDHILVSFEVE